MTTRKLFLLWGLLGLFWLGPTPWNGAAEANSTSLGYNIANYTGPLEPMIRELFPTATRIGDYDPVARVYPVFQLNQILGYAFESIDLTTLPGFAGKPINMLVGLDTDGHITDIRILQHDEPIFLHGLGPEPLIEFTEQYRQQAISSRFLFGRGAGEANNTVYLDGITKATVSVMVINDVVLSAAMTVARAKLDAFAQKPSARPNYDLFEQSTFDGLVEAKLINHWMVSAGDVEALLGQPLDSYPEIRERICPTCPNTVETWTAYMNPPTVGRGLLGEDEYARMRAEIKPDEHVIGVLAKGFYALPRPAYRDGTIPERMTLEQGGLSIPMRGLAFWRSSEWSRPAGVDPDLDLHLFKIRPQAGFNPAEPFGLGLHFDLARNHLIRDQGRLSSEWQLPSRFFIAQEEQPGWEVRQPLWLQLWRDRAVSIGVLVVALGFVTLLFLRQSLFIASGRHLRRWRYAVLIFTTGFIGYYAQGQLSVVNVYTLILAVVDGFDIGVFLLDPILFILWTYTFITLFLFGRGLFCGWLCPFGALQEFASDLGKRLGVPQWRVAPAIDRPLRLLKYVIFLGLSATAFVSLSTAEVLAEVEPFKTAITLNFVRYWPFIAYAVALIAVSMTVHKAYCRYLCPLGAGLAIAGAFPLFKWLHRRAECGNPCQLCRHKCEIGAIDRAGQIDYRECVQCLECVRIIEDPRECAPDRLAAKHRAGAATAIPSLIPTSSRD